MNTIKWELEDRSFKALYPGVYEEIEHMVAERAPAREEYLRQVRLQIEEDLRINKIKGAVTGRPKHYYSIYQKMIVRGKDFDDIYDLVAVRVIVDTVQDCYAVLGSRALALDPYERALQGLHRRPQVQPLPVAAHDCRGAGGQAGGDPDPYPRDAPHG